MIIFAGSLLISSCMNEKTVMKAEQIPLEDFFRNPEKTAYQISPNGEYFSYKAPYESRMNIFAKKRGSDEAVRLTSETDRDIAGYFWPNNDQILYIKDDGGNENWKLYGVNIDGTGLICYTDYDNVRTEILEDLPEIPDQVIIGMNKRNPQVFDPYRLDIKTGDMEMLAENPGNIQSWIFDHDGKLRAAIAIVDGINSQILYRETENDEFTPVLTTNFKETVSPMFFTFDNKNVYALSNLGRDKVAVVVFDIKNGKELEVLYENPDYDISGLYYSRKRKVLTSASYQSYKRERHFFDEKTKGLFNKLTGHLPGYELGISAYNKAEDVFIVRTYSDRSRG